MPVFLLSAFPIGTAHHILPICSTCTACQSKPPRLPRDSLSCRIFPTDSFPPTPEVCHPYPGLAQNAGWVGPCLPRGGVACQRLAGKFFGATPYHALACAAGTELPASLPRTGGGGRPPRPHGV